MASVLHVDARCRARRHPPPVCGACRSCADDGVGDDKKKGQPPRSRSRQSQSVADVSPNRPGAAGGAVGDAVGPAFGPCRIVDDDVIAEAVTGWSFLESKHLARAGTSYDSDTDSVVDGTRVGPCPTCRRVRPVSQLAAIVVSLLSWHDAGCEETLHGVAHHACVPPSCRVQLWSRCRRTVRAGTTRRCRPSALVLVRRVCRR